MDDFATQVERQHMRRRRRVLALLVGVVFLISFFLGFGANWVARMMSEPSVYCLDHSELRDGRYQLYADRSGCMPGEVCLLTTTGIVSQDLRGLRGTTEQNPALKGGVGSTHTTSVSLLVHAGRP